MRKAVSCLGAAGALALILSSPAGIGAQGSAPGNAFPTIPFEKSVLGNGLEVILSEDHRLPLVAVNLWYHVGPANEEPGAHRLRASLRAHDVPGLEARRRRCPFQDPRSGGRERDQRHDRFRPDELLRDGSVEPARAG